MGTAKLVGAALVALVLLAGAGFGAHRLVVSPLESRVEALQAELAEASTGKALAEANVATLKGRLATIRRELAQTRGEAQRAESRAAERVRGMREELAEALARDQQTGPGAEAMNEWLSDLF